MKLFQMLRKSGRISVERRRPLLCEILCRQHECGSLVGGYTGVGVEVAALSEIGLPSLLGTWTTAHRQSGKCHLIKKVVRRRYVGDISMLGELSLSGIVTA